MESIKRVGSYSSVGFTEPLPKMCQVGGCTKESKRYILNACRNLAIVRVIYLCNDHYKLAKLTEVQRQQIGIGSTYIGGITLGRDRYVDL